jgi:hypothetical protein
MAPQPRHRRAHGAGRTNANDTYRDPNELHACRRTLRGGRACTVWRSTHVSAEARAESGPTTTGMSNGAANRAPQLLDDLANTLWQKERVGQANIRTPGGPQASAIAALWHPTGAVPARPRTQSAPGTHEHDRRQSGLFCGGESACRRRPSYRPASQLDFKDVRYAATKWCRRFVQPMPPARTSIMHAEHQARGSLRASITAA